MSINESMNPVIINFLSNFLSEAKTPERRSLDTQGRQKRKSQNRQNKRNQRQKDSTNRKAADFKDNIMVVRTKNGNIEIIDKESYNDKTQQVVIAANKASMANVSPYLKNKAFVNTTTSERLFGHISGAGKGQTKESKKSSPKSNTDKEKTTSTPMQMPPQKIPATKKASKKDTFPTSHGSQEMETGIAFAVATLLGLSPQQIVMKGLLDQKDIKAITDNPNESYLPSCQRAAQQIIAQFGSSFAKHTGKLKQISNLTPEAKADGVIDITPKADLAMIDNSGNILAGLSVKIGNATQLTSGSPAETTCFIKWAMLQIQDTLIAESKKVLDDFMETMTRELSGNYKTKQGPVTLFQMGGTRQGEDEEVERREKLHKKVADMLNEVLTKDKTFSKYFVYALLTGNGKFQTGDPAIATHVFSCNKDGTDAKITAIDLDYAGRIIDQIKFKITFKSRAIENIDIEKKWNEFKDRKKQLGEKVDLVDDWRQYSFRSVLRAILSEASQEEPQENIT